MPISTVVRSFYTRIQQGPYSTLATYADLATAERYVAYTMFELFGTNEFARIICMGRINLDSNGQGYGIKTTGEGGDIRGLDDIRNWINGLFRTITGKDYSNWGNELQRSMFSTIRSDWPRGHTRVALGTWMSTIPLTITPMFTDMETRVSQLCNATTFGSAIQDQMIDVAKAAHERHIRNPINGAALFWAEMTNTMEVLMEGADGVSGLRHMWNLGVKHGKAPKGGIYDFRHIDNPPAWAFKLDEDSVNTARRPSQDRKINVFSDGHSANIYAITYNNPSNNGINAMYKRQLPTYTSKEEAQSHANEPCHFHVQAMMENQQRPMTREEAERICHPNSLCVSEFNKYIECTEVRGGADAIRQRAAMPSGEERRAVYQDQLDQVNAAGKRRGGSRIMVMMEVLPSVLEEVEIGSERM